MFCLGTAIHMILCHLADVFTQVLTKFYTKKTTVALDHYPFL